MAAITDPRRFPNMAAQMLLLLRVEEAMEGADYANMGMTLFQNGGCTFRDAGGCAYQK